MIYVYLFITYLLTDPTTKNISYNNPKINDLKQTFILLVKKTT
jgi:hypothetical protein